MKTRTAREVITELLPRWKAFNPPRGYDYLAEKAGVSRQRAFQIVSEMGEAAAHAKRMESADRSCPACGAFRPPFKKRKKP